MTTALAASHRLDLGLYTAGDVIAGRYRLEWPLGEGGMGCVWLARQLDSDTRVAVKLIRSEEPPPEATERLKREVRFIARVHHRAIVEAFDFGETDEGHAFIVMEALNGPNLAQLMDERGVLTPATAVGMLLPIADGLAAAHEVGVVHRDVKPENILITETAGHVQPKLVDFGIAKIIRGESEDRITLEGWAIGSPSYMSPEQAQGLPDVDHRADVWGLSAVLYEAVSGAPPFRASSYNALLRAIVEKAPPKVAVGGAKLWTVIERGLEKDRAHRFQSMRELGEALAEYLESIGVHHDVCRTPLSAIWSHDADESPESRTFSRRHRLELLMEKTEPLPLVHVHRNAASITMLPDDVQEGRAGIAEGGLQRPVA